MLGLKLEVRVSGKSNKKIFFFCFLQLTTQWITLQGPWWPLPQYLLWCLMAALVSWLVLTCQVGEFFFSSLMWLSECTVNHWNLNFFFLLPGDLKNPSYSIPRGTITAVIFTFIIYNLLSLLVACSCDRSVTLWHAAETLGKIMTRAVKYTTAMNPY